jgi:hypothetical protein
MRARAAKITMTTDVGDLLEYAKPIQGLWSAVRLDEKLVELPLIHQYLS